MDFETVIGLEVHVQLNTNSKIFCGCSTAFESPPNTNICPVCCGYPGVLPVLNRRALELAVRVCLALNCRINNRIYFERKNYFYPDLPKNYQISQYKLPLGEEGFIIIPVSSNGNEKKIRIKRVHLEEDAGKLIHRKNYSLVDFNRTGIPLLEIVTEPDLNSPEEAYAYLTLLKLTLQYIEVSTCDMEKGYLRCDANISVRPKGESKLGTKIELKNMNSFRGVRDALAYEARRQIHMLREGKKLYQETRLWDESKGVTVVMRTKEEAHDYRYFPEPDLVDFTITDEMIAQQKEHIGELPADRRKRFIKDYPLDEKEVDIIVSSCVLSSFFEECLKCFDDPRNIANWIIGPFLEIANAKGGLHSAKISPYNFSRIVKYFVEGKLNNISAKKLLASVFSTDEDVDKIIEKEGFIQVSSEDELSSFVEEVIEGNPRAVEDFRQGKQQVVMFLVGQVMRKTKGKANPKIVKEMIERRLKQ